MLRLELLKFQFRAILAVTNEVRNFAPDRREGVVLKYVDRTPGRLEKPKSLISCDSCGSEHTRNTVTTQMLAPRPPAAHLSAFC